MIETLYRVSVVFHEDDVNYFSRQYGESVVEAKKGCIDCSSHLEEDGKIVEVAVFSCELAAKRCENILLKLGDEEDREDV